MRVLIRTDAGGSHGLGHATRCLALARELRVRGSEVRFVTRTLALRDFCGDAFAYETSLDDYGEHCLLAEALYRWEASVLILDTKYSYDDAWLHYLDDNVCNIVRIDHQTAREESCSLLVAPVAHWDTATVSRLRHDFGERFLYGWDYVILDDAVTRQAPIPYSERAPHIVLCAGGSDPTGALDQMYAWTDGMQIDAKMLFCFGAQSHGTLRQRYDAVGGESLCTSGNRYIVPFHRDYLRQASLVVCMFGVTCYECLSYRTPALILAHTDENVHGAWGLEAASYGAAHALGHMSDHDASSFRSCLSAWYHVSGGIYARQHMHDASAGLMDGHGVQRVAEAILTLV